MIDLIHTSDWHIWDKHKYSYNGSRLNEIKNNIKEIIDYAIKKSIDIIIVTGDIFHLYNPDEKILKVFAELVHYAITNDIMLRILTGDHDYNGVNYSLKSLKTIYDYKNDDMLKIFAPLNNNIAIYSEQFNKENLVYVPFQHNIKKALKKVREQMKNGKTNLLFSHTSLDSAMYNIKKKSKSIIKPTIFSGWDYVGLGDYHLGQSIVDSEKNIFVWYSGSIIRVNSGEKDNMVGFNHIKIRNGNVKVKRVKLNDIEFIYTNVNYDKIDKIIKKKIKIIHGKPIKNNIIKLFIYGDIGSGHKIALIKKWFYDMGAKDVDDKIMGSVKKIKEGENIKSVNETFISLSPDEICSRYLKESGKKNKIYKYGIKKIKECL